MMSCESNMRSISNLESKPVSVPTTPNFVRKFHSNFRPLDLRKLKLNEQTSPSANSSQGSLNLVGLNSHVTNGDKNDESNNSSCSSSQDSSPRIKHFGSCHSHDSFILKRQSSQARLRESLLSSLLLSPRTKEIEFTVPQSLSPLTPTFGRKIMTNYSSESSPCGTSRSENEGNYFSRPNTPSPIFFRESPGGGGLGGLNPELYKLKKDGDEYDDDDKEGNEGSNSQFGRAYFALEYDLNGERLLVSQVRAKNLVSKPSHYAMSTLCNTPFVRVSLFPDERRTLQSKLTVNTNSPQFDETFGFQISRKSLDKRSLKLCFYDVDSNKKHLMLGYIIHPFKDIDWSFGKQVFREDLLRDIGELSPNIGEVLVSLCYNGNISRLTVTIFEAKGIKSKESSSGLYTKISLTQHTKIIKTKKTSTVPLLGCRSSFNESFNFKFPVELLDTASISIQLMYSQPGYNKDQSAGRIVIGSFMFARGKGLEHWTEMLSRQKEQIQYWHAISE